MFNEKCDCWRSLQVCNDKINNVCNQSIGKMNEPFS